MAVKITGNVKHNGKLYKDGDTIGDSDITEAEGKALIASGVASKAGKNTETSGGETNDRPESTVKSSVNKSNKTRKTAEQKAQERAQKQQGNPQDADRVGSSAGTKTPDAEEADVPEDTSEDGSDNADDSTDDSGNDASGADRTFTRGEDEFKVSTASNGQVQYRKNGTLISKADFEAAEKS